MKATILSLLLLFSSVAVIAQSSILGKWKTVDDDSSEPKSIVEIFEKDGKVFGKILKLYRKSGEDPDPVCDQCDESDSRFNKKIIGMEIIKEMERDGEEYGGGQILDPNNGKVYRCKLWLEGSTLRVRGYLGPFYRTQTWLKFTQ